MTGGRPGSATAWTLSVMVPVTGGRSGKGGASVTSSSLVCVLSIWKVGVSGVGGGVGAVSSSEEDGMLADVEAGAVRVCHQKWLVHLPQKQRT
jgi:hypothetical protein